MELVNLSCDRPGITTLTLNDPERRNAMGTRMAVEFKQAVEELAQQSDLRVLILTGAGGAFAAGGDLQMLRAKAELDAGTNRQQMLEFYHAFLSVQLLEVPTIAAINGHAIGAGMCLAMACDFRILSNQAKLGFTFTKLALHPGMGASLFVPRVAGMGTALDVLVTGRQFSAEEARQLGLARMVVEQKQVMPKALELAESLLLTGPKAVAGLLATLRPSRDELQEALEREASEQSRCYARAEFLEGVSATIEKRKPAF
jgi:enoyl-CoA hydratase/carnithine racemase